MKTKKIINKITIGVVLLTGLSVMNSCDDYLDKEPLDEVIPEKYFSSETDLADYVIAMYGNGLWLLPNPSNQVTKDAHTDNQAALYPSDRYAPGQWKVPENGGDWEFGGIRNCNYFLERIPDMFDNGKIQGNSTNIEHYIGEAYMLRAKMYFDKVKALGDFPIIKENPSIDNEVLTSISQRKPHSEVIRFIIEDLDTAIGMMMDVAPGGNKQRLSKYCALLLKSRVALYEATWLKYFSGTAFVPNGPGWPGSDKDYNSGYQYQAGSIEAEINWLLGQSMEAAAEVADNFNLTPNNGVLRQSTSDPINPYFNMFGNLDMSGFEEVLLWKQYSFSLGFKHSKPLNAAMNNNSTGTTKGMVESFLCEDGLPIYASPLYQGDDSIGALIQNRDNRLQLFLKQPHSVNVFINPDAIGQGFEIEPYPGITHGKKYNTGYTIRKSTIFEGFSTEVGAGENGEIIFRATEAYLNYIEACYELNGTLDGEAVQYWGDLRERAKLPRDYMVSVSATDIAKEADGDWGAYSSGELLTDKVLYNIRRERRCELFSDGYRDMDLIRWRSKDQMINTPFHIEGFKLFNSSMSKWYQDTEGNWNDDIKYDQGGTSNVSSPTVSDYLRPYEILGKEIVKDGYKWAMAHYWSPIAVRHFQLTSEGNDYSTSPIYQNPGWGTIAGQGANEAW